MKKRIKISFFLSVFCIGFMLSPSVSQAFQQEPSDSLTSTTHTCYDSYEKGTRQYIINCNKCVPVRANDCADQSTCTRN